MSAFKFRLQQVLDLREQHEKQVAAKLAEAEMAADEARLPQTVESPAPLVSPADTPIDRPLLSFLLRHTDRNPSSIFGRAGLRPPQPAPIAPERTCHRMHRA